MDYSKLKEMIMAELKEISDCGEICLGDLDVLDKLTHTLKSIVSIEAMESGTGSKAASRVADRLENMMDIADDEEMEALKDCLSKLRRARA